MFLVVFRSSQKRKKRWFTHGEKKSRTTNLDFPSVLLNQGLTTEANNNTRGRKLPLPFFTNKEEEKREKGERKREEKRQLTLLRARHDDAVCSSTHSPQNNKGENAHYTQQEKQREYIKTRSQTTRSSPHRKRTNTDLFLKRAQREKEEKEVLRARAIWIWTFQ
jgi:hypothetical protein